MSQIAFKLKQSLPCAFVPIFGCCVVVCVIMVKIATKQLELILVFLLIALKVAQEY